jgi:2-polyprenyl-6-methoxyphenol hydroxylase-like FAD-dependent oxidoreductase
MMLVSRETQLLSISRGTTHTQEDGFHVQIKILCFTKFKLKKVHKNIHGSNRPHEMRCMERKVLLEAIAGQVPQGTIRLNSRVTNIKKSETSPNVTNLELEDGSTYSAKVRLILDVLKNNVESIIFIRLSKFFSFGC